MAVSLHGTGGAWLVAGETADADRLHQTLVNSLDRKVCNTVNVCCVPRARAAELVPIVIAALDEAATRRGTDGRLHVETGSVPYVDDSHFARRVVVRRVDGDHDETFASPIPVELLANEWEWEHSPEMALVVVDDVDAGGAALQPPQSTVHRLVDRSASIRRSTTGSTPPSTHRSSVTGSRGGSTASTRSTRRSSVCRTGSTAVSWRVARSCPATRSTRCAIGRRSTTRRSAGDSGAHAGRIRPTRR